MRSSRSSRLEARQLLEASWSLSYQRRGRLSLWTGILSPILQVDGEMVEENQTKYSFVSMHAKEDILYTLDEIFPSAEVECTRESRVRLEPLSAHHLCIIEVKAINKDRSLSWPEVNTNQAVVFEEVKKL